MWSVKVEVGDGKNWSAHGSFFLSFLCMEIFKQIQTEKQTWEHKNIILSHNTDLIFNWGR